MPKKTRKQKIRSEARQTQAVTIKYDFSKVAIPKFENETAPSSITPALKQDIIKTIIIGSALILVEFGLFVFS